MVNKIFNKPWYKVDPLDKMIANCYSKNRYSKRHSLSIFKIADGKVVYKIK